MASVELADAFLADFDDDSDDEFGDHINEKDAEQQTPVHEDIPTADLTLDLVTKLLRDSRLALHMQKLEGLLQTTLPIVREDEYPVIVASNELSFEIDNDILRLNRFIRDLYAAKFPELEQLVVNALEYARVVQRIGNLTDLTPLDLDNLVPAHTIMVIKITATTTVGKPLSPEKLQQVYEACNAITTLEDYKKKIYEYVASRMSAIAPNVCALIGSDVAARLLALAGGLLNLSRMPAGNIQILGQKKKTAMEFSRLNAAQSQPHAGLIYQCDIVRLAPMDVRTKAARLVSGKLALLARIDAYNENASATTGLEFRAEVSKRIEKLQEPPPMKQTRALPVPKENVKKRRGGRRHRKFKERFEVTEISKLKNRVTFGQAQQEDETTGVEFGMMGQATGKIKVQAKNTQKLGKVAALKQARRQKKAVAGLSGGGVSGMATSLVLTASQGVELVDPTAHLQKLRDGSATYFNNTGGFFSVRKPFASAINSNI